VSYREGLNLHSNTHTYVGINYIADGCHFLVELDMRACLCISKIGRLGEGCPFLEDVNLFHCQNVDNEALLRIVAIPSLRRLNIFGVRFARESLLNAIIAGTNLRKVVMGCNKITDTAMEVFRQKRPDIQLSLRLLSAIHAKKDRKKRGQKEQNQ